MYTGVNQTALQSQQMIIAALLKLMREKPFSKISIKELCYTAQISRQTFYSLFGRKEEVIGLHLDTIFNHYIESLKQMQEPLTMKEMCDKTIAALIVQKNLIKLLVNSNLDYVVKEKLEEYLNQLDSFIYTDDEENREYAIAFWVGALMNTICLAVKNDDFDNVEKLSSLIEKIVTGNYFSTDL